MRSKSETNLVNSVPPPQPTQAHTTSSSPFLLPPIPTTHHNNNNLSPSSSPPKARRRGRSLRKTALLKPPSATHLSAPLLQPPPIPRKGSTSKSTSPRPRSKKTSYLSDSSVTSWQTSLNHVPIHIRKDLQDSSTDTIFYGWVVLLSTWVVFVIGIGSVFGVWDWAWDVSIDSAHESQGSCAQWVNQTLGVNVSCDAASVTDPGIFGWEGEGLPIDGYYPALIVLTGIMAWVWVTTAWVGLKYFKHAKIQTPVAVGDD